MQDNRVELNGGKVHPFASREDLLDYVSEKYKEILQGAKVIAINKDFIDAINDCTKMRNQWKSVVKTYKLKDLGISDPQVKRIVSIT